MFVGLKFKIKSVKTSVKLKSSRQKLSLFIFFNFNLQSHFSFSKSKPPLKRIIIDSIRMLQTINSDEDSFCSTAEDKKAGQVLNKRKKHQSQLCLPGDLLVKQVMIQFRINDFA